MQAHQTKIRPASLAISFIAWLLTKLPPQARQGLIFSLASLILKHAHSTRLRSISNIQHALPHLSDKDALNLALTAYKNICLGVAETFWLDKLSVEIECDNKTRKLLLSGTGLTVATLHMSCYEAIPLALQLLTGRSTTLSKVPVIYPEAENLYSNAGIECINKDEGNSLFKLLSAINDNRIVSIHNDHYADDMEINFFNRTTKAPIGAGMLSSLAQCPLLVGYAVREKNSHYRVFIETISESPIKRDLPEIQAAIRAVYRRFEAIITLHPDQWYWSYKRWR